MKGKIIKTFDRVLALARAKKCVWLTTTKRHQPAAMVVNYPAVMFHRLLKNGQMYEHIPPKK